MRSWRLKPVYSWSAASNSALLSGRADLRSYCCFAARCTIAFAGLTAAPHLAAQDSVPAQPPADEVTADGIPDVQITQEGEITVFGRRGEAQVPAERELEPEEIDNYAASTIGELVAMLQQEMEEGRDVTVIINGEEVADPSIFNSFPPDALERVEILQDEAGAIYSYDPQNRVVNLVVKNNFFAWHGEVLSTVPTAGGTSSNRGNIRAEQITGRSVNKYSLEANNSSYLLAEERPDYLANYPDRSGTSLIPRARGVSGNIGLLRSIEGWSVNVDLDASAREATTIQQRDNELTETVNTGQNITGKISMNKGWGRWSLRLKTGVNLSRSESEGVFNVRTGNRTLLGDIGLRGHFLDLPSGTAQLSITARGNYDRTSVTQAEETNISTSQRWSTRVRLNLPLANGADSVLPLGDIGKVDLALNGDLSGASGGSEGSGGGALLSWALSRQFGLVAGWSVAFRAPTSDQLSGSRRIGPQIGIYDFRFDESARVDTIIGGNPDLLSPRVETMRLSMRVGSFTRWRLRASAGYTRTTSANQIGRIRQATAGLESAFPDLFVRNADGRLIAIDQRPINFANSHKSEINSGFGFILPSGFIAKDPITFSINHRFVISDKTRYLGGLPQINRLSGDAGGASRHAVSARLNWTRRLSSAGLSANWQSEYRIRRSDGVDSPDDLILSPRFNLNFNATHKFRRETFPNGPEEPSRTINHLEVRFSIENVLDSRRSARLSDGREALGFDRDTIDPLGRTVSLGVNYRF